LAELPQPPDHRDGYRHFLLIPTRWMDNDVYGHVNNVVYYSYFDTVINNYLIHAGKLDIHGGPVIGIAAESFCRFSASLAFPETVEAGLAVGRLGSRSVTYLIGLFKKDREEAAARGHFVHVFVDRATMRPVEIPASIREALVPLLRDQAG